MAKMYTSPSVKMVEWFICLVVYLMILSKLDML